MHKVLCAIVMHCSCIVFPVANPDVRLQREIQYVCQYLTVRGGQSLWKNWMETWPRIHRGNPVDPPLLPRVSS